MLRSSVQFTKLNKLLSYFYTFAHPLLTHWYMQTLDSGNALLLSYAMHKLMKQLLLVCSESADLDKL